MPYYAYTQLYFNLPGFLIRRQIEKALKVNSFPTYDRHVDENQYKNIITKWSRPKYEHPSGSNTCQDQPWHERLADYYFPCKKVTGKGWTVLQQLRTPSNAHNKIVTPLNTHFNYDKSPVVDCELFPYMSADSYKTPGPTNDDDKFYSCLGQNVTAHEVDLTPEARDECGWPKGLPDFWVNYKKTSQSENKDYSVGSTDLTWRWDTPQSSPPAGVVNPNIDRGVTCLNSPQNLSKLILFTKI